MIKLMLQVSGILSSLVVLLKVCRCAEMLLWSNTVIMYETYIYNLSLKKKNETYVNIHSFDENRSGKHEECRTYTILYFAKNC